ncbi:MAG: hypothetical protein JWN85_1940, partial [Gammaproteobacteria bacterium]|nr:hypothetical protein [Gammaproteobacteria bacterium]
RPFFSQSPKRVGSGPEGPPISRGRGMEGCLEAAGGATEPAVGRRTGEAVDDGAR